MNEDIIIKEILGLKDRMANVEEQVVYIRGKMERFENGQDKMIAILERLDQERILTEHTVKRLEKATDSNTADISKIKVQLKMA